MMGSKLKDLTGKRFGRLIALERVESKIKPSGQVSAQWRCQCDCGNQKVVSANNLTSGNTKSCGCYHKESIRKKRGKGHEQFCNELNKLYPEEFEVLETYQNCDIPIMVKHKMCGFSRKARPQDLLDGSGYCPKCSKRVRKDTDYFKQEVYELVQDEYTVIGEYSGANTKILMRHNKCGNEYIVTPDKFINGRRCPKCKHSIGEDKIERLLKDNNINYFTQYRFADCVYKLPLVFDFYLPSMNICIEFDGEQHQVAKDLFGGEKELRVRQLRDSIKDNYCKDSGIKMIRIPYKYMNIIENILIEEEVIEGKC
jgi:very-short-patch-repair endonuclease